MPRYYHAKMICVGGPAAGRLIQVGPSQNSVKVISNYKAEFDSSTPVSAVLKYEVYTVRTFKFMRSRNSITEEIWYLALASWTDMQALNHLLEYYRNRSE